MPVQRRESAGGLPPASDRAPHHPQAPEQLTQTSQESAAGPQPDAASSGTPPPHGRILALDVGSHTIGQAVSDSLGLTAQGLDTIRRKNKRFDFSALQRTIRRFNIQEIVVGYPLRLSGAISRQTEAVNDFAEDLKKRFPLPVHMWDERLTSAEANRLLREADVSSRKRAKAVDRMAAVLILQSFLEARSNGFR